MDAISLKTVKSDENVVLVVELLWAATSENVISDILRICIFWPEPSLSAWRHFASIANQNALVNRKEGNDQESMQLPNTFGWNECAGWSKSLLGAPNVRFLTLCLNYDMM